MPKVYLSGPITGDPEYQRKFNQAENQLIVKGYTVLNPAKLPKGLTNAEYVRICFALIDRADIVLLLPGWQHSGGAGLEADYCSYVGKTAYLSIDAVPYLREVTTP